MAARDRMFAMSLNIRRGFTADVFVMGNCSADRRGGLQWQHYVLQVSW